MVKTKASDVLTMTLGGLENSRVTGFPDFRYASSAAVAAVRKLALDHDLAVERMLADPRTPPEGRRGIESEMKAETRGKVLAWRERELPKITAQIETARPKPAPVRLSDAYLTQVWRATETLDSVTAQQLYATATGDLAAALEQAPPRIERTKDGGVAIRPLIPADAIERRAYSAMDPAVRERLEGLENIKSTLGMLAGVVLQGLEED